MYASVMSESCAFVRAGFLPASADAGSPDAHTAPAVADVPAELAVTTEPDVVLDRSAVRQEQPEVQPQPSANTPPVSAHAPAPRRRRS